VTTRLLSRSDVAELLDMSLALLDSAELTAVRTAAALVFERACQSKRGVELDLGA